MNPTSPFLASHLLLVPPVGQSNGKLEGKGAQGAAEQEI